MKMSSNTELALNIVKSFIPIHRLSAHLSFFTYISDDTMSSASFAPPSFSFSYTIVHQNGFSRVPSPGRLAVRMSTASDTKLCVDVQQTHDTQIIIIVCIVYVFGWASSFPSHHLCQLLLVNAIFGVQNPRSETWISHTLLCKQKCRWRKKWWRTLSISLGIYPHTHTHTRRSILLFTQRWNIIIYMLLKMVSMLSTIECV